MFVHLYYIKTEVHLGFTVQEISQCLRQALHETPIFDPLYFLSVLHINKDVLMNTVCFGGKFRVEPGSSVLCGGCAMGVQNKSQPPLGCFPTAKKEGNTHFREIVLRPVSPYMQILCELENAVRV